MYELPAAAFLATEAVRRQFDPAAPPEPPRDPALRHTRAALAGVLHRFARVVAPPECVPARREVLPSGWWRG